MTIPNDVHVYLIDIEAPVGRRFFYAEPVEDDKAAGPDLDSRGFRGWVRRLSHKVEEGCKASPSLFARLGRRSLDFVRDRTHPDERLLAQLRGARSVEVHHPPTADPREVEAAWSRFLADAGRRHKLGFLGNVLVSPLTLLLMPLPGPNLLGYWFVYRAVRHWMILIGVGRARRGVVEVRFRSDDDLSPSTLPGHLDPDAVAGFLRRHGVARDSHVRLSASTALGSVAS